MRGIQSRARTGRWADRAWLVAEGCCLRSGKEVVGRGRRAWTRWVARLRVTRPARRWVVPLLGAGARRATRPGLGRAIGLWCGYPGLVPQWDARGPLVGAPGRDDLNVYDYVRHE